MTAGVRALLVGIVAISTASCASTDDGVASDGGIVTGCADANEAPETVPYDAAGASGSAPACQPSCGAGARVNGFYTVDALPFGPCSGDETCDIGARRKCPCDVPGPVDAYRCACVDGAWRCAVAVMGGAICACFDASTDGEN